MFATRPTAGAERVKVGYRRVRVSSKPDAVRSVELGRLEQGDEVEIVESYEGFLRVQTPLMGSWDGSSGTPSSEDRRADPPDTKVPVGHDIR